MHLIGEYSSWEQVYMDNLCPLILLMLQVREGISYVEFRLERAEGNRK